MTRNYDNRFGYDTIMHSPAIAETSILRAGSYVPTEDEVKNLSPHILTPVLIEWMWESPSELIPTNEVIERVIILLRSRDDVHELSQLIEECKDYLSAS